MNEVVFELTVVQIIRYIALCFMIDWKWLF